MTVIDSAIVVGYAPSMVTVGSYFARRQGSSETFFLADRTLGPFHVFGTTFSTFFGTGLVLTLASFGYRYGVGALVLPGTAVIGFLLLARAAPGSRSIGPGPRFDRSVYVRSIRFGMTGIGLGYLSRVGHRSNRPPRTTRRAAGTRRSTG